MNGPDSMKHPSQLISGDFTEAHEPFALFAAWFAEAVKSEPNDPNAMALATVDSAGLPDVRMVLLKGYDETGFVFYSHIASAKGRAGGEYDFVSRVFCPEVGIPEDPVTGSAHSLLTPFWAGRLGKARLNAFQASRRGGRLFCEQRGERVRIAGRAALYLRGNIHIGGGS